VKRGSNDEKEEETGKLQEWPKPENCLSEKMVAMRTLRRLSGGVEKGGGVVVRRKKQ